MILILTGLDETGAIRHNLVTLHRDVGYSVPNSNTVLINRVLDGWEPEIGREDTLTIV